MTSFCRSAAQFLCPSPPPCPPSTALAEPRFRWEFTLVAERATPLAGVCLVPQKFGNGPNTVSESTASNTELSEFFGAHWVPGSELSKFLSAYYLCVKANSPSFAELTEFCRKTQWGSVSSLLRNSTLETVFRPFPKSGVLPQRGFATMKWCSDEVKVMKTMKIHRLHHLHRFTFFWACVTCSPSTHTFMKSWRQRPKNRYGRYGFPSFCSISISTVGVDGAFAYSWSFFAYILLRCLLDAPSPIASNKKTPIVCKNSFCKTPFWGDAEFLFAYLL